MHQVEKFLYAIFAFLALSFLNALLAVIEVVLVLRTLSLRALWYPHMGQKSSQDML